MLTVIVILLFAGVMAFDFAPQMKRPDARRKDAAVYLALIALSFTVLLLYSLHVTIPSPAEPITDAVKSLFPIK
jgi:predicted PurR-regulated permease PerM